MPRVMSNEFARDFIYYLVMISAAAAMTFALHQYVMGLT